METLKLKAEIREKTGGLSSKKAIYENKLVPGVVYGGNDAPVAIQVKNNELLKIINNESVFNSLVELELADKKHNVVFKDVQKHPSKNIFIHFDLQKVSIQSTYNGAGGYTLFRTHPEISESGLYTKDMLLKQIIIALGGKAAEYVFYGDKFVSLGAQQDLKQANSLAKKWLEIMEWEKH